MILTKYIILILVEFSFAQQQIFEKSIEITDGELDFQPSSDIPTFEIDMRLPSEQRHVEVWKHFGLQLLKVENLFLDQLNKKNPEYLQWFIKNEEKFKKV